MGLSGKHHALRFIGLETITNRSEKCSKFKHLLQVVFSVAMRIYWEYDHVVDESGHQALFFNDWSQVWVPFDNVFKIVRRNYYAAIGGCRLNYIPRTRLVFRIQG